MKIHPALHILIVLQYQANPTRSTPCRFIKKLHLDWHRGGGRAEHDWLCCLRGAVPQTDQAPLPLLSRSPRGGQVLWGETRVCLCWHRCRLLFILIGQRTGNFSKWILHYVHKAKYKKEREKKEREKRKGGSKNEDKAVERVFSFPFSFILLSLMTFSLPDPQELLPYVNAVGRVYCI